MTSTDGDAVNADFAEALDELQEALGSARHPGIDVPQTERDEKKR